MWTLMINLSSGETIQSHYDDERSMEKALKVLYDQINRSNCNQSSIIEMNTATGEVNYKTECPYYSSEYTIINPQHITHVQISIMEVGDEED